VHAAYPNHESTSTTPNGHLFYIWDCLSQSEPCKLILSNLTWHLAPIPMHADAGTACKVEMVMWKRLRAGLGAGRWRYGYVAGLSGCQIKTEHVMTLFEW
jgi:hypothetical protein